jgi:hypothetical protein
MLKTKCQDSYEKLVCQVYQTRNEDFVGKMFNQVFWKVRWKFEFHTKFNPNNYKHCDIGLQAKYTHGIT